MQPPQQAHSDLTRLSQRCLVLTTHDVEHTERLANMATDFFLTQARSIIEKDSSSAILFQYTSDGTPIGTLETYQLSTDDMVVRRSGRQANDFLIERLFIRTQTRTCVIFTAPKLMLGKDTWTRFNAYKDLAPSSRQLGAEGIVVTIGFWDRVIAAPFARVFKAWHRACVARYSIDLGVGQARLLASTS